MSAASGKFFDRVRDTASSISGSSVSLSNSAPTGFRAFGDVYADADWVPAVFITDDSAWELTYCQYSTTGPALSRPSVPIASSNGGAQAAFSGTIKVMNADPAAYANMYLLGGPTVSGGGKTNFLAAVINNTFAGSLSTDQEIYTPVLIEMAFRSVSVVVDITTLSTGNGVLDAGLYANLGSHSKKYPGSLLMSQTGMPTGTTNGGATGMNTFSSMTLNGTPAPFPPGLYWIGLLPRVASPSTRLITSGGSNYCSSQFFGSAAISGSISNASGMHINTSSLETTASTIMIPQINKPILLVIPSA